MNLKDALCLTLLGGILDARLRKKLSELEQSTLPAFGVLIDACLHSKSTACVPAAANRFEGRNQLQTKTKAGVDSKRFMTQRKSTETR